MMLDITTYKCSVQVIGSLRNSWLLAGQVHCFYQRGSNYGRTAIHVLLMGVVRIILQVPITSPRAPMGYYPFLRWICHYSGFKLKGLSTSELRTKRFNPNRSTSVRFLPSKRKASVLQARKCGPKVSVIGRFHCSAWLVPRHPSTYLVVVSILTVPRGFFHARMYLRVCLSFVWWYAYGVKDLVVPVHVHSCNPACALNRYVVCFIFAGLW